MSRQVLFNGAVLVRPGAATKIDASQFENVNLGGNGAVAIVGEADDGEPRVVKIFSSSAGVKEEYRSGDIVEAAAILADPGDDDRIPSGARQILVYKVNNGTQATLSKSPHVFKTVSYGLQANMATIALSAGTTTIERVATITFLDALGESITEISPSLGGTAKFAIAYVGAGSACDMTISDTQLTTSVTGGPGGEDLAINFADFRSLQEIVASIDANAAYTCVSLVANVGAFDPSYLDAVSAVPILARSGAAASITSGAPAGQMRLTGLTGMLATDVGQFLTISGAAAGGNNGTFQISTYASATSVDVYNANATIPDTNNGALAWTTNRYYEYATNFDLLDWINTNSSVIVDDVDSYIKGTAGPIATFAATGLAGGARGTSSNTDWTDAFTALGTFRVNQVVPLASADATAAQGTFTYDSILAACAAHCKTMSSTLGRSERQGWSGADKTKDGLIAAAIATNSAHVVLSGQKMTKFRIATGAIEEQPEWSFATAMAGMRAGAPLGEPLTWKYVNCVGLSSDASWSSDDNDDVVDLELNGVTVGTQVKGRGFRIDKCITTYLKSDNDAFTEESIVQTWKNVSYELRRALEDRYTGRPGTLNVVRSVPTLVAAVLEQFRKEGAITDSQDPVTGKVLYAYRNITVQLDGDRLLVGVTITPTPGINFTLITLVLVPASVSLAA